LLIPNLVIAGGMGGSKESAPGKNPFELLKGAIENNYQLKVNSHRLIYKNNLNPLIKFDRLTFS